ncbi:MULTISPECIES: DUF3006 domain-containing protein [Paenibacillus]|jgi:hypothetical protein|uniref:Pyruvate kinase n=1 Tax=Paenibacillus odorifer TaxID=189426 RepID=A0ABX3GCK2_9BACL|nr:DUF3006 domain-containing protein [Paenibacillus odorifer]OMC76822.1 pyruvate kinase [Paenibacillus odorifer]OMC98136.1 pyruvate kinase [Paenibacillus odorifer]
MHKGIIDRFEGEYAVVEFEGQTEDILKSILPKEAKSGDTLIFKDNEILIDKNDSKKRKEDIQQLMDDLFED